MDNFNRFVLFTSVILAVETAFGSYSCYKDHQRREAEDVYIQNWRIEFENEMRDFDSRFKSGLYNTSLKAKTNKQIRTIE